MAELEVAVNYRTVPARYGTWVMGALMPVWSICIPFFLGLFISQWWLHPEVLSPLIATLVIMVLTLIPVLGVILAALFEDDRVVVSKEGLAFPLFMLPGLHFRRNRLWADLKSARLLRQSNETGAVLLELQTEPGSGASQKSAGKQDHANPTQTKNDPEIPLGPKGSPNNGKASAEGAGIDGFKLDGSTTDGSANAESATKSSRAKKGPSKGAQAGEVQQGVLELEFHSGGQVRLNLAVVPKAELEQFLLALEVWGAKCDRTPDVMALQNILQNESQGLSGISYTQMWEEELGRRFSATCFIPLEPNRSLQDGRLKIIRQLAFGGLSAIYLAQRDEKDLVVLKEAVVPQSADEASRKKAAELFDREAAFLMRLDHPQIAKVYDHFAEEGRSYLLLEYIRGEDLRQLVKQNGAQPESMVLQWSLQTASIVRYLHTQEPPIIHRDLTPDNLVISENGEITLIDFGAANEFVGTATGTLVGKQAYIAPEQLRGKANLQSDIYALGGTIFFLLTGKDPEPLSASHPKEVTAEVSDDLDRLVSSCTQMEAEDRPQSADELVAELGRIIETQAGAKPAQATAGSEP